VRSRPWFVALTLPAGALGALMACSSFSGEAGAPGDAGVEAGPSFEGSVADTSLDTADASPPRLCAARPDKPIMCADFDDLPTPRVYEDGTATDVAPTAGREVTSPGFSAPNALWSDGRVSSPRPLTAAASSVATHVRADVDVFVDDSDASVVDGLLVNVGLKPNPCSVAVRVTSMALFLITHCVYTDDAADYYRETPVLTNRIGSSKWTHITLDVDYAASQATVAIDGDPKGAPLSLNPSAKPGGMPFVEVGNGLKGLRVGFDDILAVAVPP
jgi:hypothetical protein